MPNSSEDSARVRLDKWLWAARFFKTRSMATDAINGGKVHVSGQRVKASRAINVGEMVEVHRGFDRYEIEVVALSSQRGPAKVAQALYAETPESEKRREEAAAMRKLNHQGLPRPDGRPTGRDRRLIRSFTGKE